MFRRSFAKGIIVFTVMAVVLVACMAPTATAQSSVGGLLDFLERIFTKGLPDSGAPLLPGRQPDALPLTFSFYVIGDADGDIAQQSDRLSMLVEALEAAEGAQFGLGISPDLATALAWTSSSALQRIRDGLTAARLSSIGSLYAPGVIAALDPWDARTSLALARGVYERLLRTAPSGYWNTGGVWRQDIISPVKAAGYSYMLVEDTIIGATSSSLSRRTPLSTTWSRDAMVIVPVDTRLSSLCRTALRTGQLKPVVDYVAGATSERSASSPADIMACALTVDVSSSDEQDWKTTLPALISAIRGVKAVAVTTVESHLKAHENLPSIAHIAAGESGEMAGALSAAGYRSWSQYNADDDTLARARETQARARSRLQVIRAEAGAGGATADAAVALLDWAELIHCQRLGGMGLPGKVLPEDAPGHLNALLPAHAAWHAMNPAVSAYAEDLNADGVEEVVLVNLEHMFVFETASGNVVSWYDLARGRLMAGPGLTDAPALACSGTLPSEGFHHAFGADSQSVTFTSPSGSPSLKKTYRLDGQSLRLDLGITASGQVDLAITGQFALARAVDMLAGRDLLAYRDASGKGVLSAYTQAGAPLGLMSMATGSYAQVTYDAGASAVASTGVPFGRSIRIDYALSFAPGASTAISLGLLGGVDRVTAHPIHELRREGSTLVASVPSYTTACALRFVNQGITVSADMVAGDAPGELRSPVPGTRFSVLSQYAWGPGPILEDAGSRLEGTASHSFFPQVKDADITIRQGRFRVRTPATLWLGIGAAALAVAALGVVILARRRRA